MRRQARHGKQDSGLQDYSPEDKVECKKCETQWLWPVAAGCQLCMSILITGQHLFLSLSFFGARGHTCCLCMMGVACLSIVGVVFVLFRATHQQHIR